MSAVLAFALAGLLAATAGPATVPTEPDAQALTRFEEAIDRIPADALLADGAMLSYVDMELAWERAGVGDDPAERLESIGALIELSNFTQTPQLFGPMAMQVEEARAEVGFTMFEIEREVAVLAPPRSVFVADVTVAADDVARAVETDPLWSDDLTEVDSEVGSYFQWGDDPSAHDLERRSPMRQLGQGGTLAVLGDGGEATTVVRAVDGESIEGVLATIDGTSDSLLDGGGSVAAAIDAAADGGGVVQAVVSQPVAFAPPPGATPSQMEAILEESVLLEPYLGVLVVEQYDGDASRTRVLLSHLSEEAATRNAELVEQALGESIDLQSARPLAELLPGANVSADGTVVVVDLDFEGGFARAIQMLQTRALFPTQ